MTENEYGWNIKTLRWNTSCFDKDNLENPSGIYVTIPNLQTQEKFSM